MASCRLLTLLPPEVRLQVWEHILVRPLDEIGTTVGTAKKSRTAKHASRTAIFRTCCQIYDEAYPVLLSANTWVIRPNRADHTWLFGLGLQGQISLRRIIVESDYGHPTLWPETFHFEIFNALPSHIRLSLTIKMKPLSFLQLYKRDAMKYMHGFAKATTDELCNELRQCDDQPRHLSKTSPAHWLAQRTKTWKELLDQLTSACPEDCEMHEGRPAAHTQSTVHLSLTTGCFYCEQEFMSHFMSH